jgi:hypothetical protein
VESSFGFTHIRSCFSRSENYSLIWGKTNTCETTLLSQGILAGSKTVRRRRGPRPLFFVPALVIIIALTAYFVVANQPVRDTPVLNFSVNLSIAYSYYPYQNGACNTTAQPNLRYTPPTNAVGIPGGIWNSSAPYSSYGVNSRYPVFSLAVPLTNYPGFFPVYVQSKVDRTYYLKDFFNVWGEPLGVNNTLGLTTPPSNSIMTSFCVGPGWYWDMCVGTSPNALHEGLWDAESLSPGKDIALLYSDIGCVSA